ncbi:UDP-N-acetylglucosamine 1-carboxyvinyltransferase MurA [Caulifigura coniformis]|uniref:UDP-N-acetylglucosamine 1-carboxyvinyltransferase n=1 Tax=Caulifigura coniformis TaxID=2527983 RepID=A0A517SGW1_9PLAN|nr:UDP-N-acetylglucosamine 1-carboxyvinyltransferase [Caulifigura coniformis]QDT55352.1 UDP-N-acetylglucosamine 1-carboxyvinyltransferase MurA [Caulifigura coniformis]
MDMLVIRGGQPLRGTVRTSGAKNAALPIMAACLLTDGPVRLSEVPKLADVDSLSQLLRLLGVDVEATGPQELSLRVIDRQHFTAPYDLVRKMRASICVLGPLVARRGRAKVSLPGGCNIGHRPIDLHLRGLEALGAQIRVEGGYVEASARRLRGATISLAGPCGSTVTGTANIMAAAVLASGVTTITSAALEPEIVDLAEFLNGLGAQITGQGTPEIRIEGVAALSGGKYSVIPDRIEAATLMIAAIATRGEVTITNIQPTHLESVIHLLREAGADIEIEQSGEETRVVAAGRRMLRPIEFSATPYPGVPTDLQAQLTALLTAAAGDSTVTDAVFPNRFMHVSELCRMGARIEHRGDGVVIRGRNRLSGASVMASDLRASAALAVAALAAEGQSVIRRVYHLDRGYERLDLKLQSLGGQVERILDSPDSIPGSDPTAFLKAA